MKCVLVEKSCVRFKASSVNNLELKLYVRGMKSFQLNNAMALCTYVHTLVCQSNCRNEFDKDFLLLKYSEILNILCKLKSFNLLYV